jgi:outer membrane immunogenic protein
MGSTNLSSNIWTGFYVGANAGGAWNKIDAKTRVASNGAYFITTDPAQIATSGSQRENTSNFIGGGQAGYNFQMNRLVFGFEAEIDSLRIQGSTSTSAVYLSAPPDSFAIKSTASSNWLFALKPKVGYATERWLLYATGGLAITNVNYNFQFSDNFISGASERASVSQKHGWTLGTGLEVKLSPYWSVRGEYLYVDFGNVSTSGVVYTYRDLPPLPTLAHRAGLISQNVTMGINYKFA